MTDAGHYYFCTTEDLGDSTVLDAGGMYEKINDEGFPVALDSGGFCGFAQSSIPEVCMSQSPEASLFAVAHNERNAGQFHVYRTTKTPDVIVKGNFDFGLLAEVRYRNPESDPVRIERHASVDLPQRALDDASETYNPFYPTEEPPDDARLQQAGPTIHEWWGEAVKEALAGVLNGESYPETIDAEDPDAAYYDEFTEQ